MSCFRERNEKMIGEPIDPFKVSATGNNLAEIIQSQLVRSGIEKNPGPHGRTSSSPFNFQCKICPENEKRNKGKFNRLSKLRDHMKKHHNYSAVRAKAMHVAPLKRHAVAPSENSEEIDTTAALLLKKLEGSLFHPCVRVHKTSIVKTSHSIFDSLAGSLQGVNTWDYLETVGKRSLLDTHRKEKALGLRLLLISHAKKPETGSSLEKRKDAFGATAWTKHLDDAADHPYNWVNKDIMLHSAADLFKVDIVAIVEGDTERLHYSWYSCNADGQVVGEAGSQVFLGEVFIPSTSLSYFISLASTGKLFELAENHRASPVSEDCSTSEKTDSRFALEEFHDLLRSLLGPAASNGYLSGAVLEEAWDKKKIKSSLDNILQRDKMHIRIVKDGGSVFNNQYLIRIEDSFGCLPEWDESQAHDDNRCNKDNNGGDKALFRERPSVAGDSIHKDRVNRFNNSFSKWELTEQGQKLVPEAKRTRDQMVDILASDPPDFKERLFQMDIEFRKKMADLDKLDKEDVCDPGRWSEKDDQLLQKFEGWVKN